MHPRSRRWHLLEYVLVRRRNRQDVLITKAMRDADGWTAHRLVNSQMKLRLQPRGRPQASTDFSCPHCARNLNSRIGLVGHLRIHHTEAGEQVPGAPTYSRRARLHCSHSSRTFTHGRGQLRHMRLHENLRLGAAAMASECITETSSTLPDGATKDTDARQTMHQTPTRLLFRKHLRVLKKDLRHPPSVDVPG
ncbi:unnamed protein product [Schistocephalus solidus]|uniref:C2H2-type domain-containing protein n=1 Tax=Schistocephalus solidus TaxID=70667 RepID=A0A183SEJ5_SCHSO|nr:unnamed protein product [Schistocephalus solidus]